MSFVVIAYNEAIVIERTLESIARQEGARAMEVIVVDDGSTDGTADVVARVAARDPRVRLIALGTNRGRGFARYTGVAAARGRLLATVDADIVLPVDWLERCCAALVGHDAVAGTAVPDGDVAYLFRRFALEPRPVGHTVTITGSNALYRADLFDVVTFDPRLREGEDVVLNHELSAAAFRTRSVPGLFVRHEEHKPLREALHWMWQSGRGASRQLRTYRRLRPPDLALLVLIGLIGAALTRARGRSPRWRAAFPLAYLLGLATWRTTRSFVWRPRRTAAFLGAIAVDSLQLSCYFAGRLAGSPPVERGSVRHADGVERGS